MLYRRAIALPTWLALRVINVAMFAAGFAALLTTGLAWLTNQAADYAWLHSIPPFTLKVAAAFLPAAVVAFVRMPPPVRIVRDLEAPEPAGSWTVSLAMVILLGAALVQVPSVIEWWTAGTVLFTTITGGELWDPSGLNFFVAVILLISPIIAFLAIAACLLTSIQVVMVHALTARAVLLAALFLQGGLTIGGYLVTDGIQAAGQAIHAAMPEADTKALGEWLASEETLSSGVTLRLLLLSAGYAVVAAFARTPSSMTTRELPVAAPTPAVTEAVTPPRARQLLIRRRHSSSTSRSTR